MFTDKDGNGGIDNSEILSEAHYYPFGRKLDGAWYSDTTFSRYPYLYNGKELQAEFDLNFYDYGARWYDPGLGSWWEVDPMAEVSRRWSPYVFSNNNPLRFIDPDGMLPGDSYDQWTQAKNTEAATADQQGLGAYSALDGGGGDPPVKRASGATPKTGQNNTTFEEQTKDLGADLVDNLVTIGKALLGIEDQDPNGPIKAMVPMPFFMGGAGSRSLLSTTEIHFMQSSIKNITGEFTVLGNAKALKAGTLSPEVLKINVWQDVTGKIWTLDHRRLAAFKLAGLNEVPVIWASPSEVTQQMFKMTTQNGGTSIRLKLGDGKNIIVK